MFVSLVRLQAFRFACTLDLSFTSWVTKVSVPINIIIIKRAASAGRRFITLTTKKHQGLDPVSMPRIRKKCPHNRPKCQC